MRRLAALAVMAGVALFGCSNPGLPGDAGDAQKWSGVLVEALKPIGHVEEMADVKYTPQGELVTDQVWLDGTLWTDSDDPAVNQQVLDDAGRAIAEAFAENPAEKSWVRVRVASRSGDAYEMGDHLGVATVTLDTLADHYGIPRR